MREVLQPVATLSALTGLCTRSFQVGEGDWPLQGLLVQVDGQLRAYINRCPHNRHPLNLSDHDFLVPGKNFYGVPLMGRCSSPNPGCASLVPVWARGLRPCPAGWRTGRFGFGRRIAKHEASAQAPINRLPDAMPQPFSRDSKRVRGRPPKAAPKPCSSSSKSTLAAITAPMCCPYWASPWPHGSNLE